MAESSIQSVPVFIDIGTGSNYCIRVIPGSSAAPPASTAEDTNVTVVKTEPECKVEKSTSPLAPYIEIQPRRIRCTECNKFTAENEEKMLRHVRKVHRGENPFQCYMCDYSTYNKCLFEEHVNIHQGIKPFKCSHCPYRSASKKNTKKHELIHRPDNPLKCQQCEFIARHIKSLQCHMNKEHSTDLTETKKNSEKRLNTCSACNQKVDDMKSHKKNRVRCSVCDCVFCSKTLAKKHMLSKHRNKRIIKNDFECAICKWSSNIKPKILLHLIHHPNQEIDESVIDVRILKECGIISG